MRVAPLLLSVPLLGETGHLIVENEVEAAHCIFKPPALLSIYFGEGLLVRRRAM